MRIRLVNFVLLFALVIPAWVHAETNPPLLYPGFSTIEDSKAYTKFKRRPISDISIIHYLIDRYSNSDVKIVYEEYRVDAPFAANLSRMFLLKQYRKETPTAWVMKWCNTTVFTGQAIWVELPDGSLRLSRDVLFEELDALSEVLAKDNIDWHRVKKA